MGLVMKTEGIDDWVKKKAQHFGSKRWPASDCGKAFRLAHLGEVCLPNSCICHYYIATPALADIIDR